MFGMRLYFLRFKNLSVSKYLLISRYIRVVIVYLNIGLEGVW